MDPKKVNKDVFSYVNMPHSQKIYIVSSTRESSIQTLHADLDCSTTQKGCASLIGRAKRAPHWGVQSRFREIYMYICRSVSRSVGMSVVSINA